MMQSEALKLDPVLKVEVMMTEEVAASNRPQKASLLRNSLYRQSLNRAMGDNMCIILQPTADATRTNSLHRAA